MEARCICTRLQVRQGWGVQTGAPANGSAARKFSCSLRRCASETTSGRLLPVDFSPARPRDLVQDWLDSCLTSHAHCRDRFIGGLAASEDPDAGWMDAPARLVRIFLEDAEKKALRTQLVSSADAVSHQGRGGVPKYVALSHCWGPAAKRPLCTTRANLQEYMASIPWDELPQIFQDTVEVCAQLHIQYVWIDSLCIAQDDPLDWDSEARKMGSVHENAYFTIAATAAHDPSAGLFKVRQPPRMAPIPYHSGDGKPSQVYAYIGSKFEEAFTEAPLDQRAWAVQEYFLSRRIVYFTKQGPLWACCGETKPKKDVRSRHIKSEFGQPTFIHFFETTWPELVRSYSHRQLTFKADKLAAIEGLRKQFQAKRPNGTYRHGLWLEDLPHDLLWYSTEKLDRDIPDEVGIPSWSWASNTGMIDFMGVSLDEAVEIVSIRVSTISDKYLIVNGCLQLVDEVRESGRRKVTDTKTLLTRISTVNSMTSTWGENPRRSCFYREGKKLVGLCLIAFKHQLDRSTALVSCSSR